MQAQLSELRKMFCKISETVNVNKSRVEHYTSVSFPDSKGYTESRNTRKGHRNKKRSYRRHSLKTSLTYNTRVQNEKYIKNFSNKALSNDEENSFLEVLNLYQLLLFLAPINLY